MKQFTLIPVLGLVLVAGCASKPAGEAYQQTREGFADAAMTPLEDLNLRRDDIPAVLADIGNPYDVPADIECDAIEDGIVALNGVLPPDWDAPKEGDDTTLSERAADGASDGVLSAVASEAGGLLPYRGWVRRLSGANSYEKKVKKAYERGAHRRTYLKALGLMKGCDPVAIPQVQDAPQRVEFRGDVPETYQTASGPDDSEPAAEEPVRTDLQPVMIASEPMASPTPEAEIKREQKTSSQPSEY